MPEGYRFADRTLTEYLAASAVESVLQERTADQDVWRTLLTIDISGEIFVPPRLRGVAAWLAEMSETAFDVIFDADPSVLIEKRPGVPPRQRYAELFLRVLETARSYEARRTLKGVLDATYIAANGYDEVRSRLQSSQPADERRRALEFIWGAKLAISTTSWSRDLLLDPDETSVLRYWASESVAETWNGTMPRSTTHRSEIVELADDKDHRVFGNVHSRPLADRLSRGAFRRDLPPTSTGILEYEAFLAFDLAQGLDPADVHLALARLAQPW